MERISRILCALVLAALMVAQVASAAPFPRRGYIVDTAHVEANIGRRASSKAAQRAAMRMLSRLIRWSPHEDVLNVSWQTLGAHREVREDSAVFVNDSDTQAQELHADNTMYSGVTRRIVHLVARQNGVFRDVTRYNAVDISHPIEIDLGNRASYRAGSRATMRLLARRLQSPFNAEYQISWKYPIILRNRRRVADVYVTYNPTCGGSFSVDRHIASTMQLYPDGENKALAEFNPVSHHALVSVGRRSGTFKDLVKYGAKGYYKEG